MHTLAGFLGAKALVLKEFNINLEGEEYVHITARKAGLSSWLLTLMGIDTTTVFRVFANRIEFQTGSLSGQILQVIPLHTISIVTCGYLKPFIQIVSAILGGILGFALGIGVFCSAGIFAAAAVFIIVELIAIISLVFYFLNKSFLVSIIPHCGDAIGICFKRSVIEGVKIDFAQAQEVIRVINQLLIYQTSK